MVHHSRNYTQWKCRFSFVSIELRSDALVKAKLCVSCHMTCDLKARTAARVITVTNKSQSCSRGCPSSLSELSLELHASLVQRLQSRPKAMNGMLEYQTQGFNGYAVKYSPFFDSRIAVASSGRFFSFLRGRGIVFIRLCLTVKTSAFMANTYSS
jgi:hypothetical protein